MILGIDIGTTSISGVLCDRARRRVLATATRTHDAELPNLPAGHHEQSPRKIFDVTQEVMYSLAEHASRPIHEIALTGQMHGIVLVDEERNPLTPCITWRDARTSCHPPTMLQHPHAAETGCFLHPGYGGLTLHHMLQRGTLPEHAHKALSIPGFVASRLTGHCTTDETLAASWGIWDVRKNRWHAAMLEKLGIPTTLLPDWVPSCTQVGEAVKDLKVASGASVYSPLGDNQAGVAGVVNDGTPAAVVNVGTSSQLSVLLGEFDFDPRFETRPFPFGRFLQAFATLCGGWSYAYLAGFFRQVIEQIAGHPIELGEVYAGMDRIVRDATTSGLQVDTRFAGDRAGGAGRTGSIHGITTDNLTPRSLARAFVEGIAGELAEAAAVIDLRSVAELALVGNAVRRNPSLRDAIQSRFGMPCRVAETPEEAAFGAVCAVMNSSRSQRESHEQK